MVDPRRLSAARGDKNNKGVLPHAGRTPFGYVVRSLTLSRVREGGGGYGMELSGCSGAVSDGFQVGRIGALFDGKGKRH